MDLTALGLTLIAIGAGLLIVGSCITLAWTRPPSNARTAISLVTTLGTVTGAIGCTLYVANLLETSGHLSVIGVIMLILFVVLKALNVKLSSDKVGSKQG